MGTHKELLERKGIYYHLVTTQVGDDESSTAHADEAEIRRRQSEQDDDYSIQPTDEQKVSI